MKIKFLAILAVMAGLLAISVPTFAHHGASAYDMSKSVTSKATFTSLTWSNPHCLLNFDIKDEKGVTHWSIEMYNPLYMTRAGWTKDMIKPGDEIMVTFHPAKNGTGNGTIRNGDGKIVWNGKELGLSEQ